MQQNFSETNKEKRGEQTSKIREEKEDITPDTTEIQRIIGNCYKGVFASKLEKLKKWIKSWIFITCQD